MEDRMTIQHLMTETETYNTYHLGGNKYRAVSRT